MSETIAWYREYFAAQATQWGDVPEVRKTPRAA
jgi:hypothetical protein